MSVAETAEVSSLLFEFELGFDSKEAEKAFEEQLKKEEKEKIEKERKEQERERRLTEQKALERASLDEAKTLVVDAGLTW